MAQLGEAADSGTPDAGVAQQKPADATDWPARRDSSTAAPQGISETAEKAGKGNAPIQPKQTVAGHVKGFAKSVWNGTVGMTPEEIAKKEQEDNIKISKKALKKLGKLVNPDLEEDVKAAKLHCWHTACTRPDMSRWSWWKTTAMDLGIYGEGIMLYFMFQKMMMSVLFMVCILMLPALLLNMSGDSLIALGHEGNSQMTNLLAITTIANLGTVTNVTAKVNGVEVITKERQVSGFSDIRDATWLFGLLDAMAIGLVFFALLFLEKIIVPNVIKQQKAELATPELFTLFVDQLPRQLVERSGHMHYAKELETHFKVLLKARLDWDLTWVGMQVVHKDDKGLEHVPENRWCGSRWCPKRSTGRDYRGRRIGTIEDRREHVVTVCWKDMPALKETRPGFPQVETAAEEHKVEKYFVTIGGTDDTLLDAQQLAMLEQHDCCPKEHTDENAPEGEEPEQLIYDVNLVRDFNQKLVHVWEQAKEDRQAAEQLEKLVVSAESDSKVSQRASFLQLKENLAAHAKFTLHGGNSVVAGDGQEDSQLNSVDVFTIDDKPMEERDVVGAFVTFSRTKHRDFIKWCFRFSRARYMRFFQSTRQMWEGHKLRVSECCTPSDVFWVNLDFESWRRNLRQVITIVLVTIVMGTVIILFSAAAVANKDAAEYSKGVDCTVIPKPVSCECTEAGVKNVYEDIPPGIWAKCEDWMKTKVKAGTLSAFASALVAVTNFVITQLVCYLGHFPKPASETALGLGITVMTASMQMLNVGFIIVMVNTRADVHILGRGIFGLIGNGEYADLGPQWYSIVGSAMLMTLLVNTFSVPLAGTVQVLTFYLKRKFGVSKTMLRMEIFQVFTPPQFLFSARHAEVLVCMTIAIIFSSALPLLWVLAGISMVLFYYSDKFILFYGASTPPRYSGFLMKCLALWMQTACWWHCAGAIWVYGNDQSSPSFCPRCETGKTILIGFLDIDSFVQPMIDMEEVMFGTARLDYVLDRLCRTSAVPSTFMLLVISSVNLIRLLVFIFGKGIFSGIITIFQACHAHHDDHTDDDNQMVPTLSTAASTSKGADNLAISGAGAAIDGAEAVLTAKSASERAKDTGDKAREKRRWRRYLIPGKIRKAEILSKPFAKEPLEHMKRHKIQCTYNVRHLLKAMIEETLGEEDHSHDQELLEDATKSTAALSVIREKEVQDKEESNPPPAVVGSPAGADIREAGQAATDNSETAKKVSVKAKAKINPAKKAAKAKSPAGSTQSTSSTAKAKPKPKAAEKI